jgi:hypothetical protein
MISLSLIGFNSSCSSKEVKAEIKKVDVPVCKSLTPQIGYCTWTISRRSMIVNNTKTLFGRTWWETTPYVAMLPPESWAPLKAAMAKICHRYQDNCKAEGIDESIQRIDELLNATVEELLKP